MIFQYQGNCAQPSEVSPRSGNHVEERAAGEQDDQQDREQEAGNRKADDDHRRGPGVEPRAVLHRLADAERDRDQIGQQRHPDAERHRDRQLLLDQLQHADVAEIALAEIEAGEIPQHQRESAPAPACRSRTAFPGFLMKSGSSPCAPRYFELTASADGADLGARAEIAAGRARDARGAAGIGAGELRDHPLDRAAGRELHDDEGDEQDAEQRRDHQQNAAGDIGGHGLFRLLELARPCAASYHHDRPARRRRAYRGRLRRMAEHVPIGDRGAWSRTIAAPSSGRRGTRDRSARQAIVSSARVSAPMILLDQRIDRRDRRCRRDCWSPWSRPPATRRYGRMRVARRRRHS